GEGGVLPGSTEGGRKLAPEEIAHARAALRVGLIDATVCPDDKAVQIVDQAWIARLGPGNCQVRSSATVYATKFADFLAMQTAQGTTIEQTQQLLESLPGVLMIVD